MPYQVSMMGWFGSGEDFCGLGWVQKFWVGLGFEKVTHDQLCCKRNSVPLVPCCVGTCNRYFAFVGYVYILITVAASR